MLAEIHHIDISVAAVLIGLLLAVLVFAIADWLLGLAGVAPHQLIAAVLAILTFLACVF